ncbi:glycosyl hydrolase [Pedobacter sp. JCM 36344]|uniref:glycosyl hydrolase n=1 Tax=Pedobacter sp. JCM 36344 TaxID=3374280 RepID=UPI00397C27E9
MTKFSLLTCLKYLLIPAILLSFSNSSSSQTTINPLQVFSRISGHQTLFGIHNREPNRKPATWTDEVFRITGKYPALWSGDFLFQQENIANRQILIDEAVRQASKGVVINLMWHACNPALDQPCGWNKDGVLSKLNDAQWTALITDGTAINIRWKGMMDEVATYLQQLKDKKIAVLFRPLHEMNQSVFWWGGRPGALGTRKLYQLTHDYFVKTKGLTNLIWVWDIQDFPSLAKDVVNYNPGDAYWDIAALDIYDDETGFSKEKYEIMVKAGKGKPIAIGECQKLPTANLLKAQPKWVFFMGWSELTFKFNTKEEINSLIQADNVISLDKMKAQPSSSLKPRFRALAIGEDGGRHVRYTKAAKEWLNKLAVDSNFIVEYIANPESLNEKALSKYQLIIQLDYPPYNWGKFAEDAFKEYIEKGKGGWIGFHHATLLGEFDGFPLWNWYSDFMGGILFKNYISDFASGTVKVEEPGHPVMHGVAKEFLIAKEEWYIYNKSPRLSANISVLASVNEQSYLPKSSIKMGDHPVVWSNKAMKAKNVYIFMGHSPELFDNQAYTRLFKNAIFWTTTSSK